MKILVPLDGSLFAERAIPVALGVARRFNSEVTFLSVDEQPGPPDGWLVVGAPVRDRLEQYLADVASRIRDEGNVPVRTMVREGPVVKAILAVSEEANIDLVVLTTHGRGPVSRMWLGSIADNLVRHATTPVLLVRPGEAASVDLKPRFRVADVLLPLDGSVEGEQCLESALRICGTEEVRYHVVTVIAPPRPPLSPYLLESAEDESAALEAARQRAAEYLDRVLGRLRQRGVQVDGEVMIGESPAAVIIDAAAMDDVDLVAMSTHGRGGVTRFLMGSVADKVVRSIDKPVLLCRELHY